MTCARRLAVVLLFAVSLVTGYAAAPAAAQDYPNKAITLICPFAPGGATDAISRILQEALSQSLGQQIVIENVGGAGGMIAAAKAARAAPDGYTIMIHQVALAAGMTMYKNLTFEAERDFTGIGLINMASSVWTGRVDLPPSNIKDLVTWMKTPGNNAKIAHAGVGSFGHLAGVLVQQELGVPGVQVPYRGAGPALNDLLAGQVDMSSQSAVQAGNLIKAGRLKGYAIIGRGRFAGLPDLPTMGELGHKKLDLEFWHMLLAPAGTPKPVIDKLNAALRHALADAKVKKTFTDGGMEIYPAARQSPEAANALLKSELKLWGDVIKANNISAQ